ncbi:hypothetical protein J007_06707 [Cryptococcus neoformans]|nr:hypothetical protein J007_06707 [Cryptococcus neoformans var. grubii]OXC57765.1 hypothetical protein C358_06801 [Cryptococcus neoformans var. grubii MW-RSA852]
MSSCAATSRVIYFHFTLPQSFSQPQRAYRTHYSPGRIPPSPRLAISHLTTPVPTCTTPALYSTATAQRLSISLPPTPEMISDHALADLANGLGIAAMAFIVLYHFVAVNGKRMEA